MTYHSRPVTALAMILGCSVLAGGIAPAAAQGTPSPHNVVLFVPDGLRAAIVDPQTAPAMAGLRDGGVDFRNSHSLFPTFTTANASAMATGHMLGDTGDFSNAIYAGFAVQSAGGSVTPFLENNAVLGEVDQHFGGDYLDAETILRAAHKAGFSTAALGKLGPTLIFDHQARGGDETIIVDDSTGSATGIPLSPEIAEALDRNGLPKAAPGRGENGKAGSATAPGTNVANVAQQKYFTDVATKIVLPLFKTRGKPFIMVVWSRDPDGTQHNQGDSLGTVTPGINGPTSMAGIRNADDNLAQLRQALAANGLAETTDILVAADHGFSTISKESATSPAAKGRYDNVPQGLLPPGFLALDLGAALGLPLFDPDAKNAAVAPGKYPSKGDAIIGETADKPAVVVAANGGSDLIYLPGADTALVGRVVTALLAQDYISGIFVDDALGSFPGTLPLSAAALKGTAVTPHPAISVSFRSYDTGCGEPARCAVEVADTVLQQGQGMHGSFSRADTRNFMAAIGPDFRKGFADDAPVSNADFGRTIAHILGLAPSGKGKLVGRVLQEAMPGGTAAPAVQTHVAASAPAESGGAVLRTVVNVQSVGETNYFDAGGFPGRTVGLVAPDAASGSSAASKP